MHEVLHWMADQLGISLDDSNPSPPRANKRCLNQRILEAGYTFRYPDYKAGYHELMN
jgi:hypothetical protein